MVNKQGYKDKQSLHKDRCNKINGVPSLNNIHKQERGSFHTPGVLVFKRGELETVQLFCGKAQLVRCLIR